MRIVCICLVTMLFSRTAVAHDTWLEANVPIVRTGEIVHLDLKLGNHGNDHRDFKLAGKVSLDNCEISVVGPDAKSTDLKPLLTDSGFSPKEGYWTGRYVTTDSGMHVVGYSSDNIRGKQRSIKSAKTYFMTHTKLDDVPIVKSGFDKPLGHAIELVPLTNPATATGPGQPIRVQVLLDSQPLADQRVSFIPRGSALDEGFDKRFERTTDATGIVTYTPKEGNLFLIVIHRNEPDRKGNDYDSTKYSATLTIMVPQLCPHCVKSLTSK